MDYKGLMSGFEDSTRDPSLSVVYEENVRSSKDLISIIAWFIAVYCGSILIFSISRIAFITESTNWLLLEDFIELGIALLGLVTAYRGILAVSEPTRNSTYRFSLYMHLFCPLYVLSLAFYYYVHLSNELLSPSVGFSIVIVLLFVAFICGFFVFKSREFYANIQDYLKARPTAGSYRSPASILYK
mmetsp:Transcript_27110/g.48642  ORF Transcript_27110/g.48642 Transcript_27110/m.48642 type:complete len:186 (+) Transcript_27110:1202-1759(+)